MNPDTTTPSLADLVRKARTAKLEALRKKRAKVLLQRSAPCKIKNRARAKLSSASRRRNRP
jgi:hypothetical protein